MSQKERKAIAGTYAPNESKLDDLPWAWFGNMFSFGSLKNLVNANPQGISDAMDCIPETGEVSEENYIEYTKLFAKAFSRSARNGTLATVSRFLAMKRPDVFTVVNSGNRKGICAAFGVTQSSLGITTYWQDIIMPMQVSPWWLHDRPTSRLEGRIWDARAALIDSIYYIPVGT